jgi:hypothetical protein
MNRAMASIAYEFCDSNVGFFKILSNLSLKIDVHPIGAEKMHVAEITVPPLNTNDTYEITFSGTGTNKFYEFKLNGKPFKMGYSYIRPKKLTADGRWQIDVDLEPLVGITSFGYTSIINGELYNYFFKVYSDYEITELEAAKSDLLISRVSLGVVIIVGIATISVAMWQGKSIKKITNELRDVTEELREVSKSITTSITKQRDQKQVKANSKNKKEN